LQEREKQQQQEEQIACKTAKSVVGDPGAES
jgi:hypothetical protein